MARQRLERGPEGPRWIPVAAAVLAVLAAVSGFVSNVRSTGALIAKNDAIVNTARSSDIYNEYEAGRIKYYVYQAALDAGTAKNTAKLRATATRENAKGPALFERAHALAEAATLDGERSERLLRSHETMEVATTLFEVSIVLVSITALVGSRLLPTVAAIASISGIVIFLIGIARA